MEDVLDVYQRSYAGYRMKHAQILLKLDQKSSNVGWTFDRIKQACGTIAGIARRFVTEGMEAALGRKKRQNRYCKVTGDVRQKSYHRLSGGITGPFRLDNAGSRR